MSRHDEYDAENEDDSAIARRSEHSSICNKDRTTRVTETEQTPLFGITSDEAADQTFDSTKACKSNNRLAVFVMIVVVIVLQAGGQLMLFPLTRICESIYCYIYMEQNDPSKLLVGRSIVGPGAIGGVHEALCKVPQVQSQVAALDANLNFFTCIPSLVLALPFGILADRWGRKPVITLCLCSFVLTALWISAVCWFWQTFDIRFIWTSALFSIIGGGSTVASALFITVLSDLVSEESRASTFFHFSSGSMAMTLLAPPTAAALMAINPWISIFLGIALQIVAIPTFVWFVPETLHHRSAEMSSTFPIADGPQHSSWFASLTGMRNMLFRDWRISALIATFLVHFYTLTGASMLLLQYVSTRYLMSFSRATFIVSARPAFTIVIFLLLIPLISHLLITRYGFDGKQKDLVLARWSALLSGLGWILIALAPNLGSFIPSVLIMTLGGGFSNFVRSFATSLVPQSDVAKLYTTISVLDTIGIMSGSPFYAWLFKVGLNLGPAWSGLPWAVLGAVHAGFAVLVFCIRIRPGDGSKLVEEELLGP